MRAPRVLFTVLLCTVFLALFSSCHKEMWYSSEGVLEAEKIKPYMFTETIDGKLNILLPSKQELSNDGELLSEEYTIKMVRGKQQLLPSPFNASEMFLYSGQTISGHIASYPGPAIIAKKDVPTTVRWVNEIQGKHILPVDYSYPFRNNSIFHNEVPVVPHAHGVAALTVSDGEPENYWTYSGNKSVHFQSAIQEGLRSNEAIYQYPNEQDAGNNWYHDHTIGITRLNVYAGLAGLYKIIDSAENGKNTHERRIIEQHGQSAAQQEANYLVISEKSFYPDGSLFYPNQTPNKHFTSWVPEFYGNTILVNGKVWPKMELKRGKHRFVMLNACQNRFLNLHFQSNGKKLPIHMVRVDMTYYEKQVVVTEFMATMASRIEFILDLSNVKGSVYLRNDAPAPYPDGDDENLVPEFTGTVFRIDVQTKLLQSVNQGAIEEKAQVIEDDLMESEENAHVAKYPLFEEGIKVFPTLFEVDQDDFPIAMFVDGVPMSVGKTCANHTFKIGQTYDFHIINLTPDSHPIHFHLINFQKVKTYKIDIDAYTEKYFEMNGEPGQKGWSKPPLQLDPEQFRTGKDQEPALIERIFRDTTEVHSRQVTVLRIKFAKNDGSPFKSLNLKGQRFVYHCHMLEHEDNEMMRYFCLE